MCMATAPLLYPFTEYKCNACSHRLIQAAINALSAGIYQCNLNVTQLVQQRQTTISIFLTHTILLFWQTLVNFCVIFWDIYHLNIPQIHFLYAFLIFPLLPLFCCLSVPQYVMNKNMTINKTLAFYWIKTINKEDIFMPDFWKSLRGSIHNKDSVSTF